MTSPSNANTSGLIAEIDAEMKCRERGYTDARGELLFRCRDALVTAASAQARIAELEARVAELEAAKWEVKHVDTMNDVVAMGLARDDEKARADRLAKALQTLEAERKRDGVNLAHLKRAVAVAYADMNRAAIQQETQK